MLRASDVWILVGLTAAVLVYLWYRYGGPAGDIEEGELTPSRRRALEFLQEQGYTVRRIRPKTTVVTYSDGKDYSSPVKADFVVQQNGRRLVAVRRTGKRWKRPSSRKTRRLMLEYAHAFRADGVLLVEPKKERVRSYWFRGRSSAVERLKQAAVALTLCGAGAALFWLASAWFQV